MLKKFLIGTMALALMLTVAVSSVDAFSGATLRKGSGSKADVMELQTLVGVEKIDGIFGNATEMKVKAWQATNGLVPVDGIFGPASMAKAKGMVAGPVQGACPTGYVTTTPVAPLFASCVVATPAQGSCPTGYITVAPVAPTFATCAAASGTPAVVTGGEGFLTNVVRTGAVNNMKIGEGSKDVKVMSFEVTAKDADQIISGLKVNFKNGSLRFTRGAGDVSVWLGSTKIGSKEVSAWSDDSNGYDYRFTSMNGVVAKGTKAILYVAVSGQSSFDMAEVSGTWTVTIPVDGVTANSSNGMYDTYGNLMTSSMSFEKSGSVSSDSKYKVTPGDSSPTAKTIRAGLTSDTADITLLTFDVKAENSDMVIQKLPIAITAAAGNGDAAVDGATAKPYVEAIAKSVKLYADGLLIGNETVLTGSASIITTFGNTSKLNFAIPANKIVKFEVKVDINDVESTSFSASDFDDGDSLTASYTDVAYGGSSIVELPNGGNYIQNRSGSATGEAQSFRSTGVQVNMGTVSTTQNTNQSGFVTSVTYNIPLTMKSFEDTLYVGQSAQLATTTSASNAMSFVLEDSSAPTVEVLVTPAGTGSAVTSTLSSNAAISGSGYKIDSLEKTFTLQVIVTGATTPTAAVNNVRVQLKDIKFFTDNALTTGATVQVLAPSTSFETGYKSINK